VLGTQHLNLTLISTAVPGATRHYNSGRALNRAGQRVATWALNHYFHRLGDD